MNFNNQLGTFMKEGGKIYACRFAMAALYGMRETDLIEGVIPAHPLDVLDATLTARREGALVLQTWTL
jgi:predicted peroxiredoxin